MLVVCSCVPMTLEQLSRWRTDPSADRCILCAASTHCLHGCVVVGGPARRREVARFHEEDACVGDRCPRGSSVWRIGGCCSGPQPWRSAACAGVPPLRRTASHLGGTTRGSRREESRSPCASQAD